MNTDIFQSCGLSTETIHVGGDFAWIREAADSWWSAPLARKSAKVWARVELDDGRDHKLMHNTKPEAQ